MTDLRKAVEMAVPLLIGYREYSGDHRIANRCGEVLEALRQALARPEPVQVRPAEFIATASIGVGADVIGMPMIWAEWPTPESSTVKWSIPVDPNNFGEPITFMGQYVGEGKVVSASFGLPKCAFEFAPYTGKGEASKIKHSLEPQPEQEELIQFKDGKWSYVRKPWVGLTDEEIKEVLGLNEAPWSLTGVALQHVMDDVRALEAKLKEKNGA